MLVTIVIFIFITVILLSLTSPSSVSLSVCLILPLLPLLLLLLLPLLLPMLSSFSLILFFLHYHKAYYTVTVTAIILIPTFFTIVVITSNICISTKVMVNLITTTIISILYVMLFYFTWDTSSSSEAKHPRVCVMVCYIPVRNSSMYAFLLRNSVSTMSVFFTVKFIPANPKIRVYEICYIHSLHRNEQLQNTVRATNSHILWNAISTTPVSPWRNLSATQLRSAVERSEPNPSLRRSELHSRPGMRLVLSRSLTFARSLSEQNFPGEFPFGRSQSSA